MSSSAVSKKSPEDVAQSARSGTIDSREHTTKASASVCDYDKLLKVAFHS